MRSVFATAAILSMLSCTLCRRKIKANTDPAVSLFDAMESGKIRCEIRSSKHERRPRHHFESNRSTSSHPTARNVWCGSRSCPIQWPLGNQGNGIGLNGNGNGVGLNGNGQGQQLGGGFGQQGFGQQGFGQQGFGQQGQGFGRQGLGMVSETSVAIDLDRALFFESIQERRASST